MIALIGISLFWDETQFQQSLKWLGLFLYKYDPKKNNFLKCFISFWPNNLSLGEKSAFSNQLVFDYISSSTNNIYF